MKWLVTFVLAVALLALTAGCEDEEKEAATATPSPAATVTATPQATPTAVATPTRTAEGEIDTSQLQGRIAFYSESQKGICIMNADGTSVTGRITSGWSADPAWSPDGEKIAFTVGDNDVGYNIYVVNADGTGEKQLTVGRHVWEYPNWSADGKRIAFEADSGVVALLTRIAVMDADGSNVVLLSAADVEGSPHCPAWSPDGRRIAFSIAIMPGIGVMNEDGSQATRLVEFGLATGCPDWSPDGKLIAFHALVDGGHGIHVMNADGTDVTELGPGENPTWSPDGRYIAFEKHGEIYVMNRDGSGVTHIAEGSNPDWSAK